MMVVPILLVPYKDSRKPLVVHCSSSTATILNGMLMAAVCDADDARKVLKPVWLNFKSLKVAFPLESVFWVNVPNIVPPPLAMERVIGTPLVASGSLVGDSTCTTTGARMTLVNLPPTGWVVNANLFMLATITVKVVAVELGAQS